MPSTAYDQEKHTILIALDLQRDVVDRIDALSHRIDEHVRLHEEERREALERRARLVKRLRWAAYGAGAIPPIIAAILGSKVV